MPIPLEQFEQYIDETILQRGLSYFKKGYVNQPEEVAPGEYEAIVEGTEDYTVRLRLKKGAITEQSCDCPYDHGPVCKHVAAVIFYLQQEELELQQNASANKKKKTTKKSKQQTVAQQVEEILKSLSHEELKQFVQAQAKEDASFRGMLLSNFAHLNNHESKALYTQQVKAILKKAAGRDGYIDWQTIRHVGKAVNDLMDTADKHFNNENYQSALYIACAVLEEMTDALQFADDSRADIGNNIELAYHLLIDIALAEIPEAIRKQLFDYTLEAYEKNNFSDWDWHLGMLDIAAIVINDEKEAEQVIALLDQVERKKYDYEFQQAQTIKLRILKNIKGEAEAEKFIAQNLSNPSLRAEAIQNAISQKDYEKAISIAKDGVEYDAKDSPGLVMDWYDWLLKIALQQKETDKIIEYARLLFINANMEKQPYYALLKKHVPKDKWNSFVEALVSDIQKKNHWLGLYQIATIYINEEAWEKLMALLKQEYAKGRISLDFVKDNEKYLFKIYAADLADLYAQGIAKIMQRSTGRNHYQNACRYIRRMIKLGAKAQAEQLIENLRATYPKRKALLDELNNVWG